MHFRAHFLALVLFVSPTAGQANYAELSDEEISARVEQVVEEVLARPDAVGLSIAVARGDRVIVDRAIGTADLEWDEPADRDTIFRAASLTKQFTAAAIMKLEETGRLNLDDPLSKFVPEFETGARRVTIRQLLNHASGVPSYTSVPRFFEEYAPRDLSGMELLDTVVGKPFDFEPGNGWKYSNTGYYLLGMTIERASGQTYSNFLDSMFFKPLGLTHTLYGWDAPLVPHRARGYNFHPDTQDFSNAAHISMYIPGAAGALSSTAGDMVRWQIALSNGKAISPTSYLQMIQNTVETGKEGVRYGFGLFVSEKDGQHRITHDGWINGFTSSLTYLPSEQLRISVISNSETLAATEVEDELISALLSDRTVTQP